MRNLFRIILILPLLLLNVSTYARWATPADADYEVEFYNKDVNIKKDGTYEETIEEQVAILKEGGREDAANFSMYYNEDTDKVTVIEAKTIYDGKEHVAAESMIQDKPLASSRHGFDQIRQISISFPKVEIGAKTYLKYTVKHNKPILENFYSNTFHFSGANYKTCEVRIISELPLYIKANDEQNVLKITKDDGIHNLNISLTKPFVQAATNEPRSSVMNPKHLTYIVVSSINSWGELSKKLAPDYEAVINQTLPDDFKAIVELAKKETNEIDQINVVTSKLAEKVQYFGDWRSRKGRFVPRDLAQVASTRSGDCKEFAASTAAMLKQLGFKVQETLVFRGIKHISHDENFPRWNMNHAILKATGKNGKVYWLDPTNFVSMAQGIFPDIADRMALVLDSRNPSYERIPNIDPEHAGFTLVKEISIVGNDVVTSGSATYKGEDAVYYTGQGLEVSDQVIRDHAFKILSGVDLEEKNKKELILPDLTSRIVKDIHIKYKFVRDDQIIYLNTGIAIKPNSYGILDMMLNYIPEQVNDLYLDFPSTSQYSVIIKNKHIPNIKSLNFKKKTPWFDVTRVCNYNGKDSEIHDTFLLKTSFISSEELATPEYRNLKLDLIKHYKNTAIFLDNSNSKCKSAMKP